MIVKQSDDRRVTRDGYLQLNPERRSEEDDLLRASYDLRRNSANAAFSLN